MNLRPRNIVERRSGGNCASSIKDDRPENHLSVFNYENTNPEKVFTCWKNELMSQVENLECSKRNPLDIFEETIGVSFGQ